MSDDRTVYRVPATMVSIVSVILLVVGVLLEVALVANESSGAVLVGMGAGWLVFMAFILALTVRPATVVSRVGVSVRRPFGVLVLPWGEIADIQVEEVSGQSAPRLQVNGAVLYDDERHRLVLPYLHEKALGKERFAAEVDELRGRWSTEVSR